MQRRTIRAGAMWRLFYWQVGRYALRHKLLAALNIASIALGVAVYLAIQIANHSATQALGASVDLVAGKASLEVRGEVEASFWPQIRQIPGVLAATPFVEGVVTLPSFPGEYLRVLGVDPFSNQPFSTFTIHEEGAKQASRFDFEQWLTDPHALAVSRDFADKYHLHEGGTLEALVNSRRVPLKIQYIVDVQASLAGSGARLAVMDVGFAQSLFELGSKISGIQLLVEKGREKEVTEAVGKLLPSTATVAAPEQRNGQVSQMLGAFQLNLSALSLVALLVGMFLVYNTVSASVARRRMEIGILRSCGVSQMQVRLLFLSEALLYGVIGLVIGGVGGILLAQILVGAVSQTISSLYILLSIDRLFVSAPQILLAMVAGLGSVWIAAWLPANEAATVSPIEALHPGTAPERNQHCSKGLPLAGLGLIAVSLLCAWVALTVVSLPWMGFASAFFLLTGASLFAPVLTVGASAILGRWTSSQLILSIAAQNLRRSLRRVSLTVAALAASVAMMTGVSVMIYSFRETINTWVKRSLVADIFIAPASNETIGLSGFMPSGAVEWLEKRPEVAKVDTFRQMRLPFRDASIRMSVVRGSRRDNLRFLEGDDQRRNALLFTSGYVLVSEPFGRRYHVRAGDRLTLPTPVGGRIFEVGGTYYDYSSDEGTVLMARENFEPLWKDPRIHSLAIYLQSGADFETVADGFRKQFGVEGNFVIYSNASIRRRVFEIFEQTFAVTSILRIIAVGVAVIGIFLTLSTLITERVREIAVLRAIGAGQGQIRGFILVEAGLVGTLSSLLGIVTGCGLSLILTFVVNKAFFGWTIQLSWPWGLLLGTPLWIIPVSLLSGWLPAFRASQLPLAPALRNE